MTLTQTEAVLLALPWLGLGLYWFLRLRDAPTRDKWAVGARWLKAQEQERLKRE